MAMTIKIKNSREALEVKLAREVRSCRTCNYFWPTGGKPQPYGPYPCYDFNSNTPPGAQPPDQSGEKFPKPFPWLEATSVESGFPKPEIMDGCRKAPIMTIGINPNLTAFTPGQQGASWCYPEFTSQNNTDEWTKYAYYYRYRTVYQECLDFDFIKKYLLKEVFKPFLPDSLLYRKNMGINTTLDEWFRGELKELVGSTPMLF